MNLLIQYGTSAAIAGAVAIITMLLNRRWTIKDRKENGNKEVLDKIKEVADSVKALDTKLDKHIQENEFNAAEEWRVRILAFDDNLCNTSTPYPSEANFLQAISDCDKYEDFIKDEKNSGFHNSIGESAIAHIREVRDECKHGNLFGQFK